MADKAETKKHEDKMEKAQEPKTEKKGLPTIAVVGIGCFIFLALIGIGLTFAGKLLFSKFGMGLVKKGIEEKTGMSISTDKGKEGISFTDKESGTEININADAKIPDNFPKDFPIYPGAKPSGSLSNSKADQGFLLVMTSADEFKKVADYYTKEFPAKGWTIKNTMDLGELITIQAEKGDITGSATIAKEKDKKETTLMLSAGPKEKEESTPVEEEPVGNE